MPLYVQEYIYGQQCPNFSNFFLNKCPENSNSANIRSLPYFEQKDNNICNIIYNEILAPFSHSEERAGLPPFLRQWSSQIISEF